MPETQKQQVERLIDQLSQYDEARGGLLAGSPSNLDWTSVTTGVSYVGAPHGSHVYSANSLVAR